MKARGALPAYWVCAIWETLVFSPKFPLQSISVSQMTNKSAPEHHHFTFFAAPETIVFSDVRDRQQMIFMIHRLQQNRESVRRPYQRTLNQCSIAKLSPPLSLPLTGYAGVCIIFVKVFSVFLCAERCETGSGFHPPPPPSGTPYTPYTVERWVPPPPRDFWELKISMIW